MLPLQRGRHLAMQRDALAGEKLGVNGLPRQSMAEREPLGRFLHRPLNEIDPSSLVDKGVVPENLANSVLTNDDLGPDSLQYGTLTSKGQQLWEDGYSNFQAGGGS